MMTEQLGHAGGRSPARERRPPRCRPRCRRPPPTVSARVSAGRRSRCRRGGGCAGGSPAGPVGSAGRDRPKRRSDRTSSPLPRSHPASVSGSEGPIKRRSSRTGRVGERLTLSERIGGVPPPHPGGTGRPGSRRSHPPAPEGGPTHPDLADQFSQQWQRHSDHGVEVTLDPGDERPAETVDGESTGDVRVAPRWQRSRRSPRR